MKRKKKGKFLGSSPFWHHSHSHPVFAFAKLPLFAKGLQLCVAELLGHNHLTKTAKFFQWCFFYFFKKWSENLPVVWWPFFASCYITYTAWELFGSPPPWCHLQWAEWFQPAKIPSFFSAGRWRSDSAAFVKMFSLKKKKHRHPDSFWEATWPPKNPVHTSSR